MNSQFTIALHILGFLAAKDGQPLTSQILAKTYGTSPVVLRRVLAKLQRAGLIQTQQGAKGGSTLARNATEINLREAYEAVTGDTELLTRHPEGCSGMFAPILAKYVNDLLGDAEQAMLRKLEGVTVAKMDQQIRSGLSKTDSCDQA